jgi:uncharacterized membrane protein YgdD (TMEM256/DUF423 family)
MNKTKKTDSSLDITRITRTIYFFLGVYILTIVIFDSGNLITREAVINRWSIASLLLLINTLVWFTAVQNWAVPFKKSLIPLLTLGLLVFAGLTTYWERGMASTSTILYVLPLLVIATSKNRHSLIATAVLAVATYSFAAVKYFNDYFNEGYRIQLWGNLVLIGGTLFAATWLIMILAGLRKDSK